MKTITIPEKTFDKYISEVELTLKFSSKEVINLFEENRKRHCFNTALDEAIYDIHRRTFSILPVYIHS